MGSQSLQYGAKTLFRHSPERHNFCRLTILRHSNIKMVAYKLSKNGWVMPFFVIFRLAREKLLVTVPFYRLAVAWHGIFSWFSTILPAGCGPAWHLLRKKVYIAILTILMNTIQRRITFSNLTLVRR